MKMKKKKKKKEKKKKKKITYGATETPTTTTTHPFFHTMFAFSSSLKGDANSLFCLDVINFVR